MCARGGFFSRAVSVTVEPGEEGELQVMRIVMMMMMMMITMAIMMMCQVMIGSLSVVLVRRDDLLQQLVTPAVGGVVLGHLAGSLYSGLVTDKQDCGVRWLAGGVGVSVTVCWQDVGPRPAAPLRQHRLQEEALRAGAAAGRGYHDQEEPDPRPGRLLGGPLHAQGDPGARVHALHTHVGAHMSHVTCTNNDCLPLQRPVAVAARARAARHGGADPRRARAQDGGPRDGRQPGAGWAHTV